MTAIGVVVVDLFGLALLVLLVNLVRTGRLQVGFGVFWIASTLLLMLVASLPALARWLAMLTDALVPGASPLLLAFLAMYLVLIFFSVRLSALWARQAELVTALALEELAARDTMRTGAAAQPETARWNE